MVVHKVNLNFINHFEVEDFAEAYFTNMADKALFERIFMI